MIIDAFPLQGTDTELKLLECRFATLYDVVDRFIVVEADTDHQANPKPYNFLEHECEFAQWRDKITYVAATGLPGVDKVPHKKDPWAREHAQREWIGEGLKQIGPEPDDILLQSDADEIPRPFVLRNLRIRGTELWSFRQKGHFWAIDWLFPDETTTPKGAGWSGTVATRVGNLENLGSKRFTMMRDTRNTNKAIRNAGWHFSWLGRAKAALEKRNSFCHPEVVDQMPDDLDWYWREGYHVGGGDNKQPVKLIPVDVDKTYPEWMQNPENVPESWYRPR